MCHPGSFDPYYDSAWERRLFDKYGIAQPMAPEEPADEPLMLTGPSRSSMATKAGQMRDE